MKPSVKLLDYLRLILPCKRFQNLQLSLGASDTRFNEIMEAPELMTVRELKNLSAITGIHAADLHDNIWNCAAGTINPEEYFTMLRHRQNRAQIAGVKTERISLYIQAYIAQLNKTIESAGKNPDLYREVLEIYQDRKAQALNDLKNLIQ